MGGTNGYKTRQRDSILRYMTEHKDHHVTVNMISDYLSQQGTPVGTATIYRHLEKLVEQGCVRKYTVDASTGACFQYVEPNTQCHEHYHLKCEKCGQLIHLKCHLAKELTEHIASSHGFTVDPLRTVFYGICRECAAKAPVQTQQEDKTHG